MVFGSSPPRRLILPANWVSIDMYDCIVNHLSETHFHKTMESEKRPGRMQDVYYITYRAIRLYVKLQVCGDAVVISFKEA